MFVRTLRVMPLVNRNTGLYNACYFTLCTTLHNMPIFHLVA